MEGTILWRLLWVSHISDLTQCTSHQVHMSRSTPSSFSFSSGALLTSPLRSRALHQLARASTERFFILSSLMYWLNYIHSSIRPNMDAPNFHTYQNLPKCDATSNFGFSKSTLTTVSCAFPNIWKRRNPCEVYAFISRHYQWRGNPTR